MTIKPEEVVGAADAIHCRGQSWALSVFLKFLNNKK